MKSTLLALTVLLAACTGKAITYTWTNILGGDWSVAANWSPNAVPVTGDSAAITNNGIYTVTILSNSVSLANLTLGGSSGIQTLINGTANTLAMNGFGSVRANGVLTVTNGGLAGQLSVATGGRLNLGGTATKFLYNFALTNQGTVNWSGGYLEIGGSNNQTTYITNSGLWQMTSDNALAYGGGSIPSFWNAGTISKTAGTGSSSLNTLNLINLPGGIISATSGTLQLNPSPSVTNYISGSYTTTSPGAIVIYYTFAGSYFTDGGGVCSGSGSVKFTGGNLYLRTNVIPGLQVTGGDLYLDTHTFQQAGVITNLTLDGAALHGTNQVAGTLTFNSGFLMDTLSVQPSGQLLLNSTATKSLSDLNLINQGTITWNTGNLSVGGTPPTIISNGGSWLINCDAGIYYGNVGAAYITNSGTIRKTAGTGTTLISGFPIINQGGGLIQVDSGIFYFYAQNSTNLAGTLRLNGGQFQQAGGSLLTFNGGTLDGSGTVGAIALIGGTISPGLNGGTGTIGFPSGLNFGSNATLVINGTGTLPGSGYDQLAVTGSVVLANCTLQVTALPVVPVGTTFVIITNDYTDAVSGTFNGLPENSVITVSGQPFKIHYAGGSGNDVTLVRDNGTGEPQLASNNYTNGTFRLTGIGNSSGIFTIQATTNFIQWTNIGVATGNLSGILNFTDTNAAKFHYRFYRTTN